MRGCAWKTLGRPHLKGALDQLLRLSHELVPGYKALPGAPSFDLKSRRLCFMTLKEVRFLAFSQLFCACVCLRTSCVPLPVSVLFGIARLQEFTKVHKEVSFEDWWVRDGNRMYACVGLVTTTPSTFTGFEPAAVGAGLLDDSIAPTGETDTSLAAVIASGALSVAPAVDGRAGERRGFRFTVYVHHVLLTRCWYVVLLCILQTLMLQLSLRISNFGTAATDMRLCVLMH
jgi:hypothetical protein